MDDLAERIERAIASALGVEPAVLIRTPTELEGIAGRNPFVARSVDLSKRHVVFLDRTPDASAAGELDPERSPPDELTLHGREIYLHLPNGAGSSKLTIDYFERVLGTRATQRNWNTPLRLIELSQD